MFYRTGSGGDRIPRSTCIANSEQKDLSDAVEYLDPVATAPGSVTSAFLVMMLEFRADYRAHQYRSRR